MMDDVTLNQRKTFEKESISGHYELLMNLHG